MAGVGWGNASHDDDLCVVKIGRTGVTGTEVLRFEGGTFEEALRRAAHVGALKASCLEKQIAFLARSLPPAREAADHRGTAADAGIGAGLSPTADLDLLFPAMTAVVSALVHETQRERGTSSLYLSSGGRLFARELCAQWRVTDARRNELAAFRERYAVGFPEGLSDRLERGEQLLRALEAERARVQSLNTATVDVIGGYSNANRELLSAIDDLARGGTGAGVSRPTALAWMTLLHAKEKSGIERAQLASAFTRDCYAEGQHATVSALIASCDSYFHVFAAAAPRPANDLLRERMQSDVATAVAKMEHVALSRRDGGFGIDPTAWFAAMTRKMDFMVEVESSIRASLVPGHG